MGRSKSLVRHEVLLPGDLLPSPQPGRWHGVITCVKPKGDPPIMHAWIVMSDIKARLQLPVLGVEEYVLPVPAPQPPLHTFGSGMSETIPLDWLPPGQQGTSAKAADRKRKAGRAAAPSATRRPAIAPPGSAHIAPAHKARKAQHDLQDPPGPAAPREGPQLVVRLAEADAARSEVWPAGTRLWVKLRGSCPWPVVMWSLELCRRKDIPQLLTAFHQGQVLVRFYGEHSSMWVRPTELEATKADEEDRERALRSWGRQHHKGPLVAATLDEIADASPDCKVEVARMMQLQTAYLTRPEAVDECDMCHEEGASISCPHCDRMFHTLCLQPPALTKNDLPDGGCWACPYCGEGNRVGEGVPQDAAEEHKLERMGLTPDWIIQAGAFKVFGLEAPTAEQPFIKGLLDPCTNSLLAPNIPAEKLYDKQLNGLKLSNSWAGYHIVLNPDFGAQTQWRFVNRAIDEVENDQVPAVLLICRNSTDTAYFQRLRPYPRVLLRRMSALFKDYDKTPIGFGIVVFCIAKSDCRALYSRFYDAFSEAGEPNIPIDRELMETGEFRALLDRLRQHAQQHHRDHWIECNLCGKWRIITYEAMMAAKDDNDWTCKKLRPPYTSCRTPQCKRELLGGRYAAHGADAADAADAGHAEDGADEDAGVSTLGLQQPVCMLLSSHTEAAGGPDAEVAARASHAEESADDDAGVSMAGQQPACMLLASNTEAASCANDAVHAEVSMAGQQPVRGIQASRTDTASCGNAEDATDAATASRAQDASAASHADHQHGVCAEDAMPSAEQPTSGVVPQAHSRASSDAGLAGSVGADALIPGNNQWRQDQQRHSLLEPYHEATPSAVWCPGGQVAECPGPADLTACHNSTRPRCNSLTDSAASAASTPSQLSAEAQQEVACAASVVSCLGRDASACPSNGSVPPGGGNDPGSHTVRPAVTEPERTLAGAQPAVVQAGLLGSIHAMQLKPVGPAAAHSLHWQCSKQRSKQRAMPRCTAPSNAGVPEGLASTAHTAQQAAGASACVPAERLVWSPQHPPAVAQYAVAQYAAQVLTAAAPAAFAVPAGFPWPPGAILLPPAGAPAAGVPLVHHGLGLPVLGRSPGAAPQLLPLAAAPAAAQASPLSLLAMRLHSRPQAALTSTPSAAPVAPGSVALASAHRAAPAATPQTPLRGMAPASAGGVKEQAPGPQPGVHPAAAAPLAPLAQAPAAPAVQSAYDGHQQANAAVPVPALLAAVGTAVAGGAQASAAPEELSAYARNHDPITSAVPALVASASPAAQQAGGLQDTAATSMHVDAAGPAEGQTALASAAAAMETAAADAQCVATVPLEEACRETIRKLARFPARQAAAQGAESEWQVLTALELARQARIAANRAFLASLQLGPQAIHSGQVAPLAPSDPSMIAAARELAKAAAVAEARKQLEGAKRHWAAKRQSRQKEAARLRAALAELAREELQEAEQLVAAEKALQDLLEHHECWH